MHCDDRFLLYKLRYSANNEEQTANENATFWATKPTTPHFVMLCNSNGEKTLNSAEQENYRRRVRIFNAMGVSWPTPNFQLLNLNPTFLSQTAFGIDFLVDKCCGLPF